MRRQIYIVSRNKKWIILSETLPLKDNVRKSFLNSFEHREIAFKYACETDDIIVVHNKDGDVAFMYDSLNDRIV